MSGNLRLAADGSLQVLPRAARTLYCSAAVCRPLLDRASYSRLDPNPAAVDRDLPRDQLDLGVLCNRKATDYQGYRTMVASQGGDPEQDNEEVSEYAALVGERVGKRMLLYRTNL